MGILLNIPQAIFYLLKVDSNLKRISSSEVPMQEPTEAERLAEARWLQNLGNP